MNINQCALAFVLGARGHCHNATTDGQKYLLHGTCIAWREPDNTLWASFAGWHTRTTLNHLKAICHAAGSPPPSGIHPNGPDPWRL